jgi:hypothetical protein
VVIVVIKNNNIEFKGISNRFMNSATRGQLYPRECQIFSLCLFFTYLNFIGRVLVVLEAVGVQGGVLDAHRWTVLAAVRLGVGVDVGVRMGAVRMGRRRGRVVRPRGRRVGGRPGRVAVGRGPGVDLMNQFRPELMDKT